MLLKKEPISSPQNENYHLFDFLLRQNTKEAILKVLF